MAGGRHLTSDDWDVLAAVCGAISSVQLDWMRSYPFFTPWLDARVRAVIDLEPLVAALRGRPFSAELRTRVGVFSDALAAFAAFYAENTFPDPLLLGTDWRFFDWNGAAAEEPDESTNLWNGRAAHTQSLSVALSNAYEGLQEIAMSDSRVRDRVRAATPANR